MPPPTLTALPTYQLPSVQLTEVRSALVLSDAPIVVNRVPEPGEVEVPFATRGAPTPIRFQVMGLDPVEVSKVRVTANGATVFEAGALEAPFTGASALFTPYVFALSFVRATPYASAERVDVRVLYDGDEVATWGFVWEDNTLPQLLDVVPADTSDLIVLFDEPLSDSGLVPERYTLRRVGTFAAVPAATRAARSADDPNAVRVGFDQPLTFGATYALHVEAVTDRYGNVIDPDHRTVTFVAYSPPVPEGRRFLLWDFVPALHKRADQETGDFARLINVLQEPTNVLLYEIDRYATLADPDRAPEDFVEAMLADLGNPFRLDDLDLADKRRLLGFLVGIYQLRGTTVGVVVAIRALFGLDVAVHPLNEGGWLLGVHELGNPDTTWLGPETSFQRFAFEVTVLGPRAVRDAFERRRIDELVHFMRNAHTHYRRLHDWVPPSP